MSGVRTDIGSCTAERIYVRGKDLANELIGQVDFIDMLMWVILARHATPQEKNALNAMMVAVMDHGFTPSTIAARMTYLGAPEAPQAAVAAGLLGAGSVFLGAMENAGQMLRDMAAAVDAGADDAAFAQAVAAWEKARAGERRPLYGFGHNLHVTGDPRVPALRAVAARNGFEGPHWRLLLALEQAAQTRRGKLLPVNVAGAVGATVADMGLPIAMARGLTLVSRTAGLIGHIVEEQSSPVGAGLWELVLRQDERNAIHGNE